MSDDALNHSTPEFRHDEVQLPTGKACVSAEVYWLYDHSLAASSPFGARYLQLRKPLAKAGNTDTLQTEYDAYRERLPDVQNSFLCGLAELKWDLAVQAPSCSPRAGEFASLVPKIAKDSLFSIFAYDCKRLGNKESGTGATVEELEAAMFPTQPLSNLYDVRRVLIIDDVYSDGKTAAAIARKLWAHGLAKTALLSVATVLRIFHSEPKPAKNWLKIVKQACDEST